MPRKRKTLPKMDCYGYQEPAVHHENQYGDVFYTCYCEGCGDEMKPNHENNILFYAPMFFKNCVGECTRQNAITEYADACKKCGQERIYLRPGGAMRKKIAEAKGETYEQRIDYCNECLDEVVIKAPCRNLGCESIGGGKFVEATFGEQIWYEKRAELTFPPNNCEVCRRIIKAFKSKPEIRPNCLLCKKPFRVTYGVLIMILKNEKEFKVPKECVQCRGLSPAERKRIEGENLLQSIKTKRHGEVARLLNRDGTELEREKARYEAAKREKNEKVKRKLKTSMRLLRKDMQAVLQTAMNDKTLSEILSNPKENAYREVQAALAHLTGGKSKMTDKEYNALPEALREILSDHPSVVGIFENTLKNRAPGMSAVQQHYEILAAAALKSKEFTSINGKKIALYSTDKPYFGIKSARDYTQPKRDGTIESDLLIYKDVEAEVVITRNSGIMDKFLLREEVAIGVDMKHTINNEYTKKPELKDELEGIRKNLNDGRLDEFFFVTNQKFGEDFKKEVTKTNLALVKDYIEDHNERFQSGEYQHMNSVEKSVAPAAPENKVDLSRLGDLDKEGNLEKYTSEVKDFVAKYEIKQVEMCEYVKYAGT